MSVFTEVKQAIPAARVLGHLLGSDRRGRWLCPFHDDHNPSLSEKDGGIVCFACGWRGDMFRFVEAHLGVSRGEALRTLADLAGIVLPAGTKRKSLPSLAERMSLIRRETRKLERDILAQTERAAAQAWRRAWDERHTEQLWDTVAIGAALDRELEMMKMETRHE